MAGWNVLEILLRWAEEWAIAVHDITQRQSTQVATALAMVSEGWLSVVQLTVSWLERPQSHPEPRLVHVYAEGREGYVLQGAHGSRTGALRGSGGSYL